MQQADGMARAMRYKLGLSLRPDDTILEAACDNGPASILAGTMIRYMPLPCVRTVLYSNIRYICIGVRLKDTEDKPSWNTNTMPIKPSST